MQEWWANDAMWLHVVGQYEGVLCPPCFDFLAKQKGWFLRWKPEQYPGSVSPLESGFEVNPMSHDDFLRALGRSMVTKVAFAEDLITSLRRERDAALTETFRLRNEATKS